MDPDIQERFEPPPEAPIFTPTSQEFADPLAYIEKIKPIVEKVGICKIRPPQDWRPPFAVNFDTFSFVPRMQRISELEATTRVKLIFLDKLYKFWDLQGVRLRVPTVGRKPLDFHKLHKIVQEEGGYEIVTIKQKWNHIATTRMNLPLLNNKSYGSVLKAHYEKYLYPYDLCEAGVTSTLDCDNSPPPLDSRSSRTPKKELDVDYSKNSEMKKLQYFGAGKKVALPSIKQESDDQPETNVSPSQDSNKRELRDRSLINRGSYLVNDICKLCGKTESQEEMLTCSSCDEVFHKYCLLPPVIGIIKGDWRCPACVAKEYKKPREAYGFAQASQEYTLSSFGEMADQFKETYFSKPTKEVKLEEIEQEFWRLTGCIAEDVTVLYGADIHVLTNGSGFPTDPSDVVAEEDERYIDSSWNLNKLPVLDRSVLRYIHGDVSGMKVPWCYVGMCFSSFCWHIEDHWSYSINYLHWGEPKTWYGVPSSHAEELESVMKSCAPELFEQSPDLLHHITTIMNPNCLMSHGIPVVRVNQHAGEFVITCPRAYHAGFNNGFNFAEAVNFCPADWLPVGRECINHYKKVQRACVFSHEELVFKMANDAQNLNIIIAVQTHNELLAIVDNERSMRKEIHEKGVDDAQRVTFESLPDDERQCSYCKTTCFLSAVTCPCSPNKLVCMEHISAMCDCPFSKKCLKYRYTLVELPDVIMPLKDRVEAYQQWLDDSTHVFDSQDLLKPSFIKLKQLASQARENQYPETDLVKNLQKAAKDAEKYAGLVKEMVNRRARTRRHTDLAIKSAARRLNLSELNELITNLKSLVCTVPDSDQLEELYARAVQFQSDTKIALARLPLKQDQLNKLLESGIALDLDMWEVTELERAIALSKWLDEVKELNVINLTENTNNVGDDDDDESDCEDQVTIDELKKLLDTGHHLPTCPEVDKILNDLGHMVKEGEDWEKKANICLQANPKYVESSIQCIIDESNEIKVYLPSVDLLQDALKRAKDWRIKANAVLRAANHPTIDQLKALLVRAKSIPVRLDPVDQIKQLIENVDHWKTEAGQEFLKPESHVTLLEILLPRCPTPLTPKKRSQKKKPLNDSSDGSQKLIDCMFAVEDMYKKCIATEIENMQQLSNVNNRRSKQCRCGTNSRRSMFKCELCCGWTHYDCSDFKDVANVKVAPPMERALLCSYCVRSKRPQMDSILKLLVMLDRVPVRFPEGEALQSLTERSLSWQSDVREFLKSANVISLQEKFNVIKKRVEGGLPALVDEKEHLAVDHDYLFPVKLPNPLDLLLTSMGHIEPDEETENHLNRLLFEGHLLEVSIADMVNLRSFQGSLKQYFVYKKEQEAAALENRVLSLQDMNVKDSSKEEEEDSSQSKSAKKRKKKQIGTSKKGKKKRQKGQMSDASDAQSSIEYNGDEWGDYDDQCAAKDGCLLPDDESIGWVQCDKCELWFHFVCVGVNPDELLSKDYLCDVCEESRPLNSLVEHYTESPCNTTTMILPTHQQSYPIFAS